MNRYDQPKVTVLMPVYNGAPYLAEAIQSVLQQTFTDFEFLIIDDGSTDNSAAVIQKFHDTRIRLFQNSTNLGLVASLNMGIKLAHGEFIARMDADDVCLPERLALQVAFMKAHREIGICGTWVEVIGEQSGQILRYPTDPDAIKCAHLFGPALAHPTVMLRSKLLNETKLLYDPSYKHAEDFELWVRAAECTSLANIGKVLLYYRLNPQQVSKRHSEEQNFTAERVRAAQLCTLGIYPSDEELYIHRSISLLQFETDRLFVENVEEWFCKLINTNMESKVYSESALFSVLCDRWFEVCDAVTELGPWTLKKYFLSPLGCNIKIPWRRRVAFIFNCLVGKKRGKC